ncbi:MAG: PAS domain S-box protein, partial [Pseudomonadota bacterium]|nr:PAS domain S-box protein [Pseudomonadota bacterium]
LIIDGAGDDEACSRWQFRCKDQSVLPLGVRLIRVDAEQWLVIVTEAPCSDENAFRARQLAAIVESSQDAIIGLDLKGEVTCWNTGAELMFGYAAQEMMGTPVLRLVPVDRQKEHVSLMERIREGLKVDHFITLRQAKDHRLLDVSLTLSPIKDDEGHVVGVSETVREMTLLKEHEREIERLLRLYAALSQVNQAIVWVRDKKALFEKVCQVLIEYGGFQMAWISWYDSQAHALFPVAVSGDKSSYIWDIRIDVKDCNYPETLSPSGTVFCTGVPYVANSIGEDPGALAWLAELETRGYRAFSIFPIRMNGQVQGTLSVFSDETGFFRDKEIDLLKEAASDLSFAVDNLELEKTRQQAELAAQSERQFSDTMIESMPGILYFYDERGRFLRWNKNFEVVSGYSAEEIRQMHPLDFFMDKDKPSLEKRIEEVFKTGEACIEASFRSKDGSLTPYFFTGRRVILNDRPFLVGVGIDVSERIKTELEVHKMQGRLEAVVENLSEGLVIADPEGDLLLWNPESLRLLGFSDLEEGRRRQNEFADIFELRTLDGVKLALNEWPLARVRRGESIQDLQLSVRRIGSAEERIMSYTGSHVTYWGNKALAFMTLQDITLRKRAETALRGDRDDLERQVAARTADLQAALVRAEAADKLKSAFLATMSHELRTPLNSIIGFTGLLLQGMAGPMNAEQSKQLGMVQTSSRHLLELINDVLDISKIEADQLEIRPEPFDIQAALNHVMDGIRPMAEKKGLILKARFSSNLGEMISDRRRIEQIFINLLNNAIKFTESGHVMLEAGVMSNFRMPSGTVLGSVLQACVIDTGIGIKPEDLACLFQPFHQIDGGISRQHEGTGLGLAISRKLARLLKGEMSVRSEWS